MLAEADQLDRLVREAHAALDRVREVQQAGGLVEDGDVDDLRVEDFLELVADEVVDRLRIELTGDRRLHAVDERELRVSLAGLVDELCVVERDSQAAGDRRQQPLSLTRRTRARGRGCGSR